ncbi:maltose ABC transporter periplasmic protein [Poriferisphaera corsica]|uniref:Maltose ABC transporter periplasmic protein n=1 Tax=Poriferisphaera corsica TaxID=2528020 RepID=A0A517YTD2_9BACT|nr:ABC transporter substrate-binding protein [Poriferisphaera corsica]QDU33412.1 maltose ABC transporter periplasmic protein [Poriferisphaera corsica]
MRINKCLVLIIGLIGLMTSMLSGCGESDRYTDDGKLVIQYWEKWTGFEYDAMKAVVDKYNESQDKVFVEMLPVSQLDSKLLLATAGGNPPDVSGLWSYLVKTFSEKGALTPLDKAMAKRGISTDDYIPVLIDLCQHRGFTWGLPATPATIALHWNKKLFRESGLDPNMAPQSLEELDAMSDALTIVRIEREGKDVEVRFTDLTDTEKEAKNFDLVRVGHLPHVPGWFNTMWVYWFDGDLLEGDRKILADSPENLAALAWYRSYTEKLGVKNVQQFAAGFGNFASPQDAFLSGKVAMVIQGVWMHNFIEKYAPSMEWAAAPFPSVNPKKTPFVTIAECDTLVVPKGAKHPEEAFDFIAFVQKQENMELLCMGQKKFSPLKKVSDDFVSSHPNPYIQTFIDGAWSKDAKTVPKSPIWKEYTSEMGVGYEQVLSLRKTPEDAAKSVQERIQRKLDGMVRRWDAVKTERLEQWANDDTF